MRSTCQAKNVSTLFPFGLRLMCCKTNILTIKIILYLDLKMWIQPMLLKLVLQMLSSNLISLLLLFNACKAIEHVFMRWWCCVCMPIWERANLHWKSTNSKSIKMQMKCLIICKFIALKYKSFHWFVNCYVPCDSDNFRAKNKEQRNIVGK